MSKFMDGIIAKAKSDKKTKAAVRTRGSTAGRATGRTRRSASPAAPENSAVAQTSSVPAINMESAAPARSTTLATPEADCRGCDTRGPESMARKLSVICPRRCHRNQLQKRTPHGLVRCSKWKTARNCYLAAAVARRRRIANAVSISNPAPAAHVPGSGITDNWDTTELAVMII